MTASVVRVYRDKNDVPPLPPIPDELRREFREDFAAMMNSRDLDLFQKLEAAYAYFDRYNAFVSTFAVCSKGCNHCCKMDVQLTRLEAEYIQLKTGGKHRVDGGSRRTTGHRDACPFLGEGGACSIYSARPFNCRTFHALDDPKYCKTGEDHKTYGSAGFGYGADTYLSFAVWLETLHAAKGYQTRDIRDWFPA
jgi:Fe-S-cluster containining protein